MKKLLKKHFAKFEEGQDEISPQLLEKIYALENKEERTIKKSFNYKNLSIRLAPFIIIIALVIPMGIKLFSEYTAQIDVPNHNNDQYVIPTDHNSELLALSRNGNFNIAKALIKAVDDYKENNNDTASVTSNGISYLSTKNLSMNLNSIGENNNNNRSVSVTNNHISYLSTKKLTTTLSTTEKQDSNQEINPIITYDFEFVDFYDTYEFYVDVDLENDFTANFEDTHFRVLISNVDLYTDDMTVWNSEGIIVLINQAGQMISYLTNGASYGPDEVELEFSNHKWLDGSDVVKDIDVSPHYTFTLDTNYKDSFNLTYTQYETKNTNQTDQFTFNTVKDSYYKVEDSIMFDLKNLTDRVATVTFLELINDNKFSFEYQGDIYYSLFDETILDKETLEMLPPVNTLTIIFDGYFVGDSLDTISAQKITIDSRVATVTFLELIDDNKFSFEYQGDIYYSLFDETILDKETLEMLPPVNTLTIIFDGYFVGDSLDTISAQKITIDSRVATVTFLELIDDNKFSFEYQGDIYYCLFDETILDEEIIETLPDVDTLTIIYDGNYVGNRQDTISAQQITIESYRPQESTEETTESTEESSDVNN